jgi:hypothetical protein
MFRGQRSEVSGQGPRRIHNLDKHYSTLVFVWQTVGQHANKVSERFDRLSKSLGLSDADILHQQKLSKGGAIFIDRPDTPLVQIRVLEFARGVGETQIRGAFRE